MMSMLIDHIRRSTPTAVKRILEATMIVAAVVATLHAVGP